MDAEKRIRKMVASLLLIIVGLSIAVQIDF